MMTFMHRYVDSKHIQVRRFKTYGIYKKHHTVQKPRWWLRVTNQENHRRSKFLGFDQLNGERALNFYPNQGEPCGSHPQPTQFLPRTSRTLLRWSSPSRLLITDQRVVIDWCGWGEEDNRKKQSKITSVNIRGAGMQAWEQACRPKTTYVFGYSMDVCMQHQGRVEPKDWPHLRKRQESYERACGDPWLDARSEHQGSCKIDVEHQALELGM